MPWAFTIPEVLHTTAPSQRRVRADGGEAAFAPPDHLLFAAASTIAYGRVMAQHFDPVSGVADGEPMLVADSVFNPGGPVGYAVSGAGLLVYQQRPYFRASIASRMVDVIFASSASRGAVTILFNLRTS